MNQSSEWLLFIYKLLNGFFHKQNQPLCTQKKRLITKNILGLWTEVLALTTTDQKESK